MDEITVNRCASCHTPISDSAEWCCESCANGQGHADTCRRSARQRVTERHTTNEETD